MDDELETMLLDPAEVRADSTITIPFLWNGKPKHVKARKLDMTVMIFEGLLPMPLLAAVKKMMDNPNAGPVEQLERMTDEEKQNMIKLLRQHACKAVFSPVFVMDDDGDPTHLPVAMLGIEILMQIWGETAVVPMMNPAAAGRFRVGASPVPDHAAPSGESVQPAAEPVAAGGVELKHA